MLLGGGGFLTSVYVTLRFVPRVYESDVVVIVPASTAPRLASFLSSTEVGQALSSLSPTSLAGSADMFRGILGSRNMAQRVVEHFQLHQYYQ